MQKSLDRKLAAIAADPEGARDFIICDAKDQDMAFGVASFGLRGHGEGDGDSYPYRSRPEFLDQIRAIVAQGVVDIMLTSNSTSETLALEEKIYEASAVTPAVRANDTTDIHVARGAVYPKVPSRPFRSATLEQIQCGKVQCNDLDRAAGPDLGLYSITFNNDIDRDLHSLEAYKTFRLEAERVGFRHFLEVFNPNMPNAVDPKYLGGFLNDLIVRTLAAVPKSSRPIFLKTVFQGPRHMEELVRYDPHMVIGVLGGAAGTTFDAFDLLHQAKKAGARAALFGRKINQAEHQCAFIRFLRYVADEEVGPAEAVRAYHGVLQGLGIKPLRSLRDDLMPTTDLLAGEEASSAYVIVPDRSDEPTTAVTTSAVTANSNASEPDFDAMTSEQKLDYNQKRRDRIFG